MVNCDGIHGFQIGRAQLGLATALMEYMTVLLEYLSLSNFIDWAQPMGLGPVRAYFLGSLLT